MLVLHNGVDHVSLRLKESPHLLIAPMEDWAEIVQRMHCNVIAGNHLGVKQTLEALKSHCCIDMQRYGIPISFIKDIIKSCVACNAIDNKQVNLESFPDLRNKSHGKDFPKEIISTSTLHVENALCGIMLK